MSQKFNCLQPGLGCVDFKCLTLKTFVLHTTKFPFLALWKWLQTSGKTSIIFPNDQNLASALLLEGFLLMYHLARSWIFVGELHSYPLALGSDTKKQLYFINDTENFRQNKTKTLTCLKQAMRSIKPTCFLKGWFDSPPPSHQEAWGFLRPLFDSLGYQNHLGSFPTMFVSGPHGKKVSQSLECACEPHYGQPSWVSTVTCCGDIQIYYEWRAKG